ncbi:MAG TPA: RNase adapter RapZ [Acidimicrobiia bacterium]|jgi:UPF0042 nucleotide-binding protein
MEQALDVTIISGMSGAGRSEAARVLEDLGFFVIDNLPPELISKVAELARGQDQPTRYALVVDVRSGDFLDALGTEMARLRNDGATVRTLFLDASDDVLVRRYEESRRRHPLSESDRVGDGITRERRALEELKGLADVIVDTSALNVHQLRDRLRELFDADGDQGSVRLQTSILSFGYKHGLPIDVDMVLDCRFLPNPHWIEELRPKSGLDPAVRDYVLAQRESKAFLKELDRLFALLIPAYEREGKSYLAIGIGCTGGRHRSVVMAEELARLLARRGTHARVHHRDVDRG